MSTTRAIADQIVEQVFGTLARPTLIELADAIDKALQAEQARTWDGAAQRLRAKAEEWRLQAERWQCNAQSAGMDIIREQDYADRDVCLSKMSAAMALAIEFDEVEAAIREGKPQ
jgi:hypothetical protein